ncbi:MAG TPA: sigma 54-interacting transcriptional regulator [Ktedonobacteraceae bacterium]|nr:sigma 54-interacting transcriptional regulator [Ktedonobacteraceae bacterium]
MLRKDRVFETLRVMCTQRPAQRGALRRYSGFSAEEVAERAQVDRTNASRDLNLLVQEGLVERIPGRPVLFSVKLSPVAPPTEPQNGHHALPGEHIQLEHGAPAFQSKKENRNALLVREPGKPPSIAASVQHGAVVTSFDTLIGSRGALKVAVQQAKAAMLYPPRGLHTLICGPSGVGKTTLARLMFTYAQELEALPPDAPFISFNCADYANNPQLLMAQLFGVARGAYTGADRDRAGLVEQANHGILFLDEVHRLPPEGQEMLFYLMDRERFRRLGDAHERQSSLLLLAATTEDASTSLLPTFRRRIPMTIALPGLHERTVMERYELLRAFFTMECSAIGSNIQVDPQVLHAFLVYDCPGNVGQMRTDVQLTCAHAYLEYRSHGLGELHVHPGVLPDHVRQGLLRTADLHRYLEPVKHLLEAVHIFTSTGLNLDSIPESAHDLYDTINADLNRLRRSGLPDGEINRLLHLDIQDYFMRFADQVSARQAGSPPHLVDERIAEVSEAIVQYAQEQLERQLPEKLALVLAMHLTSTLEHLAQGRQNVELAIQPVRHTHPIEYEVARSALAHFSTALGVALPESETEVLAVLLANADALLSEEQTAVGIVVATHGRGVAAGLAALANALVGGNPVRWAELTLDETPEQLLTKVAHWVQMADQGRGVLLLVDFTSLLPLGELVASRTGLQVRAVADVSAAMLVEAVRRAQRAAHVTLEQLALSLANARTANGEKSARPADTSDALQPELYEEQWVHSSSNGNATYLHASRQAQRVILSICLTGFGSAEKIAELIEEHIPGLREQHVEIFCMNIGLSSQTTEDLQRQIGNRSVVAIVGTINPHLEHYPFISLTDLLFGDGIARLRTLLGETLIDPVLLHPALANELEISSTDIPTRQATTSMRRRDLLLQITASLSQRLMFLNPVRALPLVESMIELIEVEVGESFDIDVLAGLILHLACILERERGTLAHRLLVSDTMRSQIDLNFVRELGICRAALHILSEQIGRSLPDEEAYNIVGILRQIDLFIVEAR